MPVGSSATPRDEAKYHVRGNLQTTLDLTVRLLVGRDCLFIGRLGFDHSTRTWSCSRASPLHHFNLQTGSRLAVRSVEKIMDGPVMNFIGEAPGFEFVECEMPQFKPSVASSFNQHKVSNLRFFPVLKSVMERCILVYTMKTKYSDGYEYLPRLIC